MLRTTSELKGYAIGASDGKIGHVVDAFIDDAQWVVRWLVVETGSWLSSRRVLISPMTLGEPDRRTKSLPASITREQVRRSPDIDTDMPVSRQHEIDLSGYYGFGPYWNDAGLWEERWYANPMLYEMWDAVVSPEHEPYVPGTARAENADPHLESNNELIRYQIHASDGDIGHVRDLLVEDHSWAVRYLVVETGHWWHGESVLVPPSWITRVDWDTSEIHTARPRRAIERAPAYDPGKRLDAEVERALRERFAADA